MLVSNASALVDSLVVVVLTTRGKREGLCWRIEAAEGQNSEE
jgi:hypothetical protein